MTLHEIKERVKREIPVTKFLQKAPKGGYICPHCGSGTGKHKTGAVKVYSSTNSYFCHSCNKGGDVIYLYSTINGAGFRRAVEELGGCIGLALDTTTTTNEAFEKILSEDDTPAPMPTTAEGQKDFSAYYEKCMLSLTSEGAAPAIEYLQEKRGIPLDLALDFRIGYDAEADPAGTGHPAPRIIIPTNDFHYVARAINENQVDKSYWKMNPKGAKPGIFNMAACYKQDAKEVFIVEGAFDALSIIAAGREAGKAFDAIGLNSTNQTRNFIELIEKNRPGANVTFILCLDADEAGRKAEAYLSRELNRLGISSISADISGAAKDANEAWTTNRADFSEAIENAMQDTAARPDNTSRYIDSFMGGDIEHFRQERKTGFPSIDAQTGGLYPGLYVLAAISSLGKTSFCLQLADQLAEKGEDVLFFSLEMSRLELVSKSLARLIATATGWKTDGSTTSLDIRRGFITDEVKQAAEKYKATVGDRLSIVEANFDVNISSIGEYVRRYMDKTGTRPTVFLDYLQILQPKDDDQRKGKREALDNTVTELKRLSRETDAPFIVVSSVNRMNYSTPISFESLKESGGIEYSADVIWGMQLQCISTEKAFDKEGNIVEKRKVIEAAKKANPRKIEMKCLKNRFGISSFSCFFDYFPAVDLFEDKGEDEPFEPIPSAIGRGRQIV